MKISVIIPVYNEFRTFNQVLERVRQAPRPEKAQPHVQMEAGVVGRVRKAVEIGRDGGRAAETSAREHQALSSQKRRPVFRTSRGQRAAGTRSTTSKLNDPGSTAPWPRRTYDDDGRKLSG